MLRQRLTTFVCTENAADLQSLTGLIDHGRVTPAVDRVLPLAAAPDALALLLGGSVRGKLALSLQASATGA